MGWGVVNIETEKKSLDNSTLQDLREQARLTQSGIIIDESHPLYAHLPESLSAGIIVDFTGNIRPVQKRSSEKQA